ncbi:MASE1 domain-containing protein [Stenotrophomonas sp. 24(2023)]|uniref:MASE1 domain-containing protein n=1 Tax=Stenotrophomonas sp. 24(2023) TaxID=3068324 RepID=UPI0027DFAB5C|nr:MASE1 domain-containing protein [Stenotrophomonas sp. 24(2023)]WMJ71501.1 MASE1 domain-containing protein [Stenotrophomonas sp. 24(2023)]
MDWWKEGIQVRLRIRPEGWLLALAYAVACWGARQLSLDQFFLPAGVRVAALLLCPPRLWPYLLIGEYAYFAHLRIPLLDKYGLIWVICASVFLMPAVMLIVRLHRQLLSRTTIVGVISIAFFTAVVVSLLNIGISSLLWPPLREESFTTYVLRYALGDFIGILVAAPLALLWIRRKEERWTRRAIATTAAALALILLIGLQVTPVLPAAVAPRGSLQLLLLLPVPAIVLTCLLGWRGAAVGVTALNMVLGLGPPALEPDAFDAATFATQQAMAITSVALLLLGARISHFQSQHRQREEDGRAALQLARNSHLASEMDLRERAAHLRRLGDGMDLSLNEMVNWLHSQGHHAVADSLRHTTEVHSRLFRAQASMIYPSTLERLGLFVALQAGGVREAWNHSHRIGQPWLMGDPCKLEVGTQLVAYRLVVEAVSLLLKCENGQIAVRIRCGRFRQRQGLIISIALVDIRQPLAEQTQQLATEQLLGRILAHGGRMDMPGNRIRIMLLEAQGTSARTYSATELPPTLRPVNPHDPPDPQTIN